MNKLLCSRVDLSVGARSRKRIQKKKFRRNWGFSGDIKFTVSAILIPNMNKTTVVLLASVIIIGAYFLGRSTAHTLPNDVYGGAIQDLSSTLPSSTTNNSNNMTTPEPPPILENQNQALLATLPWRTYSNSTLGFSFQYPSNWQLTENPTINSVTIATSDATETVEGRAFPTEAISFRLADKTYFANNKVSTKVGIITYDENLKALVSDTRCLKAGKLFGNFPSNTTMVRSISYGGSLMSDPAYSDSAILTTNGQIIIVHSEQGGPLSPEMLSEMSRVASTFLLIGSNTIFVPACAQ